MNRSIALTLAVATSLSVSSLTALAPASAEPAVKSDSKAVPVEAKLVKGTRIKVVRPRGFKDAPTFSGFVREENHSTVMVTEMPAPYDKLIEGFTADKLAEKNMKLISKEPVEVSGFKGVMVNLKQNLGVFEFEKWITVFGDDKASVIITSAFPATEKDALSEPLKKVGLSAVWVRDMKLDKTADLLFKVKPEEPFKLAERVQNALLFTRAGIFPATSVDEPIYVVAQSFALSPTLNKKEYALQRVKQISSTSDVEEDAVRDIQVSGLTGIEIVAHGVDSKTKEPVYIYQAILYGKKQYVIAQGLVSKKKQSEYEKAFEGMTKKLNITL